MNCDGNRNFIMEMDLTTMNNIICTERYMNNTPVKTNLPTANIGRSQMKECLRMVQQNEGGNPVLIMAMM